MARLVDNQMCVCKASRISSLAAPVRETCASRMIGWQALGRASLRGYEA